MQESLCRRVCKCTGVYVGKCVCKRVSIGRRIYVEMGVGVRMCGCGCVIVTDYVSGSECGYICARSLKCVQLLSWV